MPEQAPPSRRRPPSSSDRRARELSYHTRKCSICRHPQRREIEQAFLNWDCVSSITTEFQLPGRTALYRHAHAVGLLANRNRGLRGALARIIEKAADAEPEPMAIVRAVEVFARINDSGEWISPKRPPRTRTCSPDSATENGAVRPAVRSHKLKFRSLQFRLEYGATC